MPRKTHNTVNDSRRNGNTNTCLTSKVTES